MTDAPDLAPTDPEVPREGRVVLHAGFELDAETVSAVSRQAWARVILIAGPEGSGKTTLLTSLYESFQRGTFANYSFAGSLTLPAFERLAHHSRIVSQRGVPETERTPPGERRRYLHLRLKRAMAHEPRDVLFTDLAGEQFRLVSDSEDECKRLTVAKRADHLAVLIDGQKLIDLDARGGAQNDARRLIRSLVDSAMIGGQTFVQVLFSKWDLLAGLGDGAEALKYALNIEKVLGEAFGDRVGSMRFMRIAARPQSTAVPFAYGLPDLLRLWCEDSLFMSNEPSRSVRMPAAVTEFERFEARQLRERSVDG